MEAAIRRQSTYDTIAGEVWDLSGVVHFRQGDRIRVKGAVVEGRGDPPPCYATYSLIIDRLEAA